MALPPDTSITVEPDADLHTPASEAVLAGLMAYNAAKLPTPEARFAVLARDVETDEVQAGISVVLYKGEAESFWAGWSVPGAEGGPALPAVLAFTERDLARRGARVLRCYSRAHDDRAPYLAGGYRETARVRDHIRGDDFVIFSKALGGDAAPLPATLVFELREPLSRPMAKFVWRQTDQRRQRRLGVPVRWASAYVRQGETVKGGALCYAAGDDFMVDMVWLDESLRGSGTGYAMLDAALDAGRALGCTRAGVETMDCQAPRFYPKLGFQPIAYLPSDVPGMGMTFFQMRL